MLNEVSRYTADISGLDVGVEYILDYRGNLVDPDTGVLYDFDFEQFAITPYGVVVALIPQVNNPEKSVFKLGIACELRPQETKNDMRAVLLIDDLVRAVSIREFLNSDIGQSVIAEFMDDSRY